jgi:hypothetical protein
MKSKEEIKAELKSWMIMTVRSTQRRAALAGQNYQPSDISFVFRDKLGIKMNEAFVLKCLGKEKNIERTKT